MLVGQGLALRYRHYKKAIIEPRPVIAFDIEDNKRNCVLPARHESPFRIHSHSSAQLVDTLDATVERFRVFHRVPENLEWTIRLCQWPRSATRPCIDIIFVSAPSTIDNREHAGGYRNERASHSHKCFPPQQSSADEATALLHDPDSL